MQIETKNWRGQVQMSLAAYVEGQLIESDNSGCAEAADCRARNCATAIGKLLDVLAEMGVLTIKEAQSICGGTNDVKSASNNDGRLLTACKGLLECPDLNMENLDAISIAAIEHARVAVASAEGVSV